MRSRRRLAALPSLALVAVFGTGAVVGSCGEIADPPPGPGGGEPGGMVQEILDIDGFVEPHTPGSGAQEEVPLTDGHPIVRLLDPNRTEGIDLNRVSYVRTAVPKRDGSKPRVILILIPGFLGGGTTFDPLARDLVREFAGNLEVWAIDRRPNQLEDRLGAAHAIAGVDEPACTQPAPSPGCSIFEGAQFYFADLDDNPTGDFPGPNDLDVNRNGILDPQMMLMDDFGNLRLPINMKQNDVRKFFADWGMDTYFRDWEILIEHARSQLHEDEGGMVLLGGHSQGTSWAATYAAYDLDPSVGVVRAGHETIDGLLLIEGGGIGPGVESKAKLAGYELTIAGIRDFSVPAFLDDFSGIPLVALGNSGEVASIAGFFQPDEPALIQRTPTFATGLLGALLAAPATNQAVAAFFLDDDFSPVGAFRGSIGFSSNGPNVFTPLALPGLIPYYQAQPADDGSGLRSWIRFDEVQSPVCSETDQAVRSDCAIVDHGPPPRAPGALEQVNGVEREVSDIDEFLATQFGKANGFEWYFVDRRVSLDFEYGNDSSDLVAESVARDGNEGPLVITQNANVDVPVLAIGGSNGLVAEKSRFDRYLGSIATPERDKRAVILEGYAHLDPIIATDNDAVPLIVGWVNELLQRKLLESF